MEYGNTIIIHVLTCSQFHQNACIERALKILKGFAHDCFAWRISVKSGVPSNISLEIVYEVSTVL